MERKLQQRIVGILVLASFVLLIAPVLLDAEGRIPEKITNIPPQPKRSDLSHIYVVESEEDTLPAIPDSIDSADSTISARDEKEPTVVSTSTGSNAGNNDSQQESASSVTSISKQELWSVQVASFLDPKKASSFRDELRGKNYQPYVREKLLSDGSLFTQVFVGPVSKKNAAKELKEQIKKETGEQGLIVKYNE